MGILRSEIQFHTLLIKFESIEKIRSVEILQSNHQARYDCSDFRQKDKEMTEKENRENGMKKYGIAIQIERKEKRIHFIGRLKYDICAFNS